MPYWLLVSIAVLSGIAWLVITGILEEWRKSKSTGIQFIAVSLWAAGTLIAAIVFYQLFQSS